MKDKALQSIVHEVQSQVSSLQDVPDVVKLLVNLVEVMAEKIELVKAAVKNHFRSLCHRSLSSK